MTVEIIPVAGGASGSATFTRLIEALGIINGDGIYKSPIHFTAVHQAATVLDLSGYPAIVDVTQFIAVVQVATDGTVTYYMPSAATPFSWNGTNGQLTIGNAVFDSTDVFGVIISAADRYSDTPGDFKRMAEVNHFQTQGDSAGIDLIPSGPVLFTSVWAPIGPNIDLTFIGVLEVFGTYDVNDSTGLQVRLVEFHESGGAEEYPSSLETYGSSSVGVRQGYHVLSDDVDQLLPLTFVLRGAVRVGQLQIKAGVLGAGVDAQVDALYAMRSTFGG